MQAKIGFGSRICILVEWVVQMSSLLQGFESRYD